MRQQPETTTPTGRMLTVREPTHFSPELLISYLDQLDLELDAAAEVAMSELV